MVMYWIQVRVTDVGRFSDWQTLAEFTDLGSAEGALLDDDVYPDRYRYRIVCVEVVH